MNTIFISIFKVKMTWIYVVHLFRYGDIRPECDVMCACDTPSIAYNVACLSQIAWLIEQKNEETYTWVENNPLPDEDADEDVWKTYLETIETTAFKEILDSDKLANREQFFVTKTTLYNKNQVL